jgi:VWFA-related protein
VVLDVLVSDSHGDPVKGLTLKDFELREDGEKRALKTAEEHGIATPGGEPETALALSNVPGQTGVFSNKPPSGEVWNVLLFDSLSPSWEVQASARQQLEKYVRQLPPEQPVALVIMGSPSRLVVPFSGGAAGILKFLTAKESSGYSTVFLAADQGTPLIHYINDKQPNAPLKQMRGPKGSGVNPVMEAEQEQNFRQLLNTFDNLADWLSHYPGRKNVYWLSDGFPSLPLLSDALTLMSPKRREGPLFKEIQQMNKLLQNARVAVSPIDISGVHLHSSFGGSIPDLRDFADQTGGVLRINNNDIGMMLHQEFNRSQNFYTLTYTPSGKNWNGQYRKISLALKQQGYQLAYRQGYYAVDVNFKPTTLDDFNKALNHGAEQANDVVFAVHAKIDAGNVVLDYSIDPHNLEFATTADGHHNANVECVVTKFDAAGKLLGTARTKGVASVPAKKWAGVYVLGIPGREVVPLEAGVAFLRVGIRDSATGRFGTLEMSLGSSSASR